MSHVLLRHTSCVTRHASRITRHTSHIRWHAVIDAVKIMQMSAGGGGPVAAPAPPLAAAAPLPLQQAAALGGGEELVGIGLSIAPDMTVTFFNPQTKNQSPVEFRFNSSLNPTLTFLPQLARQVLNVIHGGAAWANGQVCVCACVYCVYVCLCVFVCVFVFVCFCIAHTFPPPPSGLYRR